MVDFTSITGALSGLNAAIQIVQGLKSTADSVAINEAKIGLQSAILDAQSGLLAAQSQQAESAKRIEALEQEIVHLKDWSTEAARYEPVDIYIGTIAYMPKLGMENGEPPHWLCANCFQRHRKSFLSHKGQTSTKSGGRGMESRWGCDECGYSTMVSYRSHPDRIHDDRVKAASSEC